MEWKFNLQKDEYDERDFLFKNIFGIQKTLPTSIDLRDKMPEIENQGNLGACQSFAINAIISEMKKNNFKPSHLFVYYNIRDLMGRISEDTGGTLRDTCKAVEKKGVCDRQFWRYAIEKFAERPPEEAYQDAVNSKITSYHRITSIQEIKQALVNGLIPLVGVIVYESMQSAECILTGEIPMPKDNEQQLGGHAMDIVAYYDAPKETSLLSSIFNCLLGIKKSKGYFILRNSWGTGIGIDGTGYFKISYEAFMKIVMDMWVINY